MNQKANANDLGIVIPCYKEAENIGPLIRAIRERVPSAHIAVIDDSPNPDTVEATKALGLPQIYIEHRAEKGGRGSAVIQGFGILMEKNCDPILEMDADFSHPPEQINELLDIFDRENYDLLIASRYLPESQIIDWPLSRLVFSHFANRVARFLLKVPVSDYTNGYRMYSAQAVKIIIEHCGKLGKGFVPLSEILVQVYYRRLKVGETATVFINRRRGESSVNPSEICNAAVGLLKIAALRRSLKSRS